MREFIFVSILGTAFISTALMGAATYAATLDATGSSLTLGPVTMASGRTQALHNPASGAYIRDTYKGTNTYLGSASLSMGLEYGDVDDLFALIDSLSGRIESGDDTETDPTPQPSPEIPEEPKPPISWLPPDFDINDPDTQETISQFKKELAIGAALIGFVGAEGYSRVNASVDLPLLINKDLLEGTFTFKFSSHVQGGAIGFADPITFDEAQALAVLEELQALTPDSPAAEYDLSAGLTLTVDPANQKAAIRWDNDSTLLTKAARTYELAASYSRALTPSDNGQWYLGVTPRLLRIGMSNVATRIGDISNAQDFFDDVFNRELRYSYGLTADLGALWVSDHYRAGATIKNLYPSKFEYPSLQLGRIQKQKIIQDLNRSRQYQLDTQGRLEGSWFSSGYQWQINGTLETNAAQDAIGDLNQWFSVSLQYQPAISWLPNIRAGHHRNLKGTKLNYGAVGATLFKYLEIDLGFTLDTVTIKNNDLPRGLNLNLGFNYGF